jgi:hypothetical protein
MNAPSIDIRDMLLAEVGLNLAFTTNLFIANEPANPDTVVTIFDTYGYPPQLTMDNALYEKPGVFIRVRSEDYNVGWQLINDIYLLLHGRAHETWNGTMYEVITCSSPTHYDWDDSKRARFIINLNLQRR